jgi:hypothetical protein
VPSAEILGLLDQPQAQPGMPARQRKRDQTAGEASTENGDVTVSCPLIARSV